MTRFLTYATLILPMLQMSPRSPQQGTIFGEWEEPTGSIVRIEQCGKDACIWIAAVSTRAPAVTDIHNPDKSLRQRPLCGLEIGNDFTILSNRHAENGTLYDPKSGHTYHGDMKLVGSQLHLRGYVGLSIFGKTEVWQRPLKQAGTCPTSESKVLHK